MNKRRVWRWVKLILALYGSIGIILFYTQDYFIWHPVAVPPSTMYHFGDQPHTEIDIPFDPKTTLNVVEFKATDRPADSLAKGVVLCFHGNRGDIEHNAATAADFTRNGYEAWLWDYPGYGKSTGERSEQKLYDYALQLYKLARSRWHPSQIIIDGQNIGTGIASELADVRDCRMLILESPFYSLESLAYHYLPIYPWGRMLHYHFPTWSHLPKVTAPVIIFQGTDDRTGNASRLKPLLKPGDEFVTIPGAGQNDLHRDPVFKAKLDSLLAR